MRVDFYTKNGPAYIMAVAKVENRKSIRFIFEDGTHETIKKSDIISIEECDQYDVDDYLDQVNDIAWQIINKKDLNWVYPTEPIYPLKWYICYGKAPAEFVRTLIKFGKWTIANILVTYRDNDNMDIVRKIERRITK